MSNTSRYATITRKKLNTSPHPEDQYHTLQPRERLDILAFTYLGNVLLWWAICDYNDITDPLTVSPGTVLRIPSWRHLEYLLCQN